MRCSISKFDLTGNEIWSKMSFMPLGQVARLEGQDFLIENNEIITLISGDDDGTSGTFGINFFIQFSDLNGNLDRVIKYDISSRYDGKCREIARVTDGYLILGSFQRSQEKLFLVKTNKIGDVIWGRRINIPNGTEAVFGLIQQQIFAAGNAIFIIGQTTSNGDSDALIVKLNADGDIDNCDVVSPLNISATPVLNATSFDISLTSYDIPDTPLSIDGIFSNTTIPVKDECVLICDELCYNNVDDDGDGLVDCDDPDLQDSCCCIVPNGLELGPDSTICIGNSIDLYANATWYSYDWSTGESSSTINVSTAGIYWLQVVDSCDNIFRDSVEINVLDTLLQPDLGPDISVCENGVFAFSPGNGYLDYEWQDGSRESTYTAWESGIYHVSVWDGCRWMSDSVQLTIDSTNSITLMSDTVLCPEDTLLISLNGFDRYVWYPDGNVDCDTCNQVKIQTDTALWVTVIGRTNLGCISIDSMHIDILELEAFDTLSICNGDTLTILGQQVWQAGDYSGVTTSHRGCDSISNVHVTVRPDYMSEDSIQICEGDTVVLFGEKVFQSGLYQNTLQSVFNCDSVVQIKVDVRSSTSGYDTIALCLGDTVQLNGMPVFGSGAYSESRQNQWGCDSTLFIQVNVSEPDFPDILVHQPNCVELSGSVEVLGSPVGVFEYNLNDSGYQPILNGADLTSGGYLLEVRDIATLCLKDTFFEIEEIVLPSVLVPDEIILEAGNGYLIPTVIDPQDNIFISWSPSEGLSCADCARPLARPSTSTTYIVTLIDQNGCIGTDTIHFRVVENCEGSLYIPNVFSPNDDGINDAFEVYNLTEGYQVNSMRIYHRW